MDHLFALGRYEDIRPVVVGRRPASSWCSGSCLAILSTALRWLSPTVPCRRATLLSELRQRFVGRQPGAVRTELVEDFVHRYLNDDGYLSPVVSASTVVAAGEDAAALVVKIEAGALAAIATATVRTRRRWRMRTC